MRVQKSKGGLRQSTELFGIGPHGPIARCTKRMCSSQGRRMQTSHGQTELIQGAGDQVLDIQRAKTGNVWTAGVFVRMCARAACDPLQQRTAKN